MCLLLSGSDGAQIRSAVFFFLMIRRPPRSTLDRSSAASDVYKRQEQICGFLKNWNAAVNEAKSLMKTARGEI